MEPTLVMGSVSWNVQSDLISYLSFQRWYLLLVLPPHRFLPVMLAPRHARLMQISHVTLSALTVLNVIKFLPLKLKLAVLFSIIHECEFTVLFVCHDTNRGEWPEWAKHFFYF